MVVEGLRGGVALRCTVEHDFLCLLPRRFPFLFFMFTPCYLMRVFNALRVCHSQGRAVSAVKAELFIDSLANVSMVLHHVRPIR